jgi:hypothetical protein
MSVVFVRYVLCSPPPFSMPSPRSHSTRLSSNNNQRFGSRNGHVCDTRCKIVVADVQHNARKGDALDLNRDRELSPRESGIVAGKHTLGAVISYHQLHGVCTYGIRVAITVEIKYGPCDQEYPNAPLQALHQHTIETSSTAFRLCVFSRRFITVHAWWQS